MTASTNAAAVPDGQGLRKHLHRKWSRLIVRCGSAAFKQAKPSYALCTQNFGTFEDFFQWAARQIGCNDPAYFVDKDLLVKGNKLYSPDTCVFVPREINMFLTTSRASRGQYPIGVTFDPHGCRYVAKVTVDGRQKIVGRCATPEDAFAHYKIQKELNAKRIAEKWKSLIDPRAYAALLGYRVEITD